MDFAVDFFLDCVPRMTKGKSAVRAALDVSLLPQAESSPGCPSDDGTRHWSGARASLEGCSALTITILAQTKAQLAQTPLGKGTGGAGWHPPTRPMTIVSRGSSSSVLPGLGKPRWVSEGHPKRAILRAPAERAGGVSAFFCADKEPEGAGAQPGTGGHGTRGGEPTAMRTLRSTARGSQALGQNLGGHPAFAGGVTGSPGTALCTPAAFQAKPPPTCCVNTAGAWRSHFSSTQLWREAQHLPLTMRLTHSQTPGSLRLLLGMLPAPWPPHSPVCPHHGSCCPPRHPPPGQKLNPWWGNQPSSWPWVVSLGFYLALIHPGLKV